jgi:hypothetical protein
MFWFITFVDFLAVKWELQNEFDVTAQQAWVESLEEHLKSIFPIRISSTTRVTITYFTKTNAAQAWMDTHTSTVTPTHSPQRTRVSIASRKAQCARVVPTSSNLQPLLIPFPLQVPPLVRFPSPATVKVIVSRMVE